MKKPGLGDAPPDAPPTNCRDCGSDVVHRLGRLPDVSFFAGTRLERPLVGGELWHCARCDLRFRHPHLDAAAYDALYDNALSDTWAMGAVREDQRLVLALVDDMQRARPAQPLRVLDFGCYAGDLLTRLPAGVQKFGVEVNASAGARAAMRAGARVERDLDDFPAELRFDLIVAMDVIEHVSSPRALLQRLAGRLAHAGAEGARIALTTGDGDNWLWRRLGARWWYCHYPEHIAFISERWLAYHADALGLSVDQARRFNYLSPGERPGWISGWRALLRYVLAPSAHRARQRRHLARHGTDLAPPGLGLTRDHLLLVVGQGASGR